MTGFLQQGFLLRRLDPFLLKGADTKTKITTDIGVLAVVVLVLVLVVVVVVVVVVFVPGLDGFVTKIGFLGAGPARARVLRCVPTCGRPLAAVGALRWEAVTALLRHLVRVVLHPEKTAHAIVSCPVWTTTIADATLTMLLRRLLNMVEKPLVVVEDKRRLKHHRHLNSPEPRCV